MKPSSDEIELLLKNLMTAPEILSRSLAAIKLGNYGDTRAIEPLRQCLNLNIPDLTKSAIKALGMLKDKTSIPNFIAFLNKSQDKWIRIEAIGALCELHHLAAQPYLREMLHDEDHLVRHHAMLGLLTLSERNGSEIKADLNMFLLDINEENRRLAQDNLELIRIKENKEFDMP